MKRAPFYLGLTRAGYSEPRPQVIRRSGYAAASDAMAQGIGNESCVGQKTLPAYRAQ